MFRREAVNHQYNKLWGDVTLSQPLSHRAFFFLLVSIFLSGMFFIFNAEYKKKQTVSGYLLPNKGVIKTYSPGSVYVTEVFIQEGQYIEYGMPLFRLKYKHSTDLGIDLNDILSEEINKQLSIINDQKIRTHKLFENRKRAFNEEINSKQTQIELINMKIIQAESRKLMAENRLFNYEKMSEKGFLSDIDEESQRDLLLTLQQDIVTLKAKVALQEQEIRNLNIELEQLPLEEEKEIQDLLLSESQKKNRLTELSGKSEILLRSSSTGRVTGLDIKVGQLLRPQQYMSSILPEGSVLYAELMVPTSAFGFVSKGQVARIKLDAFPFQKFGMLDSEIYEMTGNIILPGEFTLPIANTEPMYRIKAKLAKQTVQAYGKEVPLQAGMQLEADIITDTRSLAEWLMEPLFSLRGVVEF
ncbi:HlyD family efflux transporter periplasmic adaptor subunit [Photobacterium sp. 2_MG-2023]|uniref:HlyD family secretion protein n=1 Tax=Photobacterium sp. 2_MG-2023 TaxID=3062663 RepID=UPI0026E425C2|nr:HlyD family efflux transporter periplasmic adaptor subunit [Photobacterium sp. 2_MG-2023]MDO6581032.1 HlyD family efflux transporter periplasmic adaptor subunit [Photobacterium sp. 2_MG-2023]